MVVQGLISKGDQDLNQEPQPSGQMEVLSFFFKEQQEQQDSQQSSI